MGRQAPPAGPSAPRRRLAVRRGPAATLAAPYPRRAV